MTNPYASPETTQEVSPTILPVWYRIFRAAGLTICFSLALLSLAIGCYGLLAFYESLQEEADVTLIPSVYEFVAALLLYFGFGTCWLLAGILFVAGRRAWGWVSLAVGVAISIVLFSILGV